MGGLKYLEHLYPVPQRRIYPRMWSALGIGLPCAAIGFFLGMGFLKRINREQFLRIVYLVLLFIGANMLITSLMAVL